MFVFFANNVGLRNCKLHSNMFTLHRTSCRGAGIGIPHMYAYIRCTYPNEALRYWPARWQVQTCFIWPWWKKKLGQTLKARVINLSDCDNQTKSGKINTHHVICKMLSYIKKNRPTLRAKEIFSILLHLIKHLRYCHILISGYLFIYSHVDLYLWLNIACYESILFMKQLKNKK